MSRRSQVMQQQRALQNAPRPAFAPPTISGINAPAGTARQMQVDIGQLAEVLMSQGAKRGYNLMTSPDPKIVRLVAKCGPLSVPLDFTPEEARKLGDAIKAAADTIDAPPVEEPVPVSPEAEALLQEFITAAGGAAEPVEVALPPYEQDTGLDTSWLHGTNDPT